MSAARSRRDAERLVEQLGLDHVPVDVEKVAAALGLRVVEANLGPDVSGLLVSTEGRAQICVQAEDARVRKRFTIGHEIGHHYLRHQFEPGDHVHVDRGHLVSKRGSRAAAGIDLKEIEANQFAASLLMPSKLVRREAAGFNVPFLRDHHVSALAEQFQVSEQAMTIRLTDLGLL